jgi:GntR family transcriptional regulator, carbon starvation induced regulator
VKVPSNGKVITKTNETYQILRNAILWGELPAGARLRTNLLTKEYDISLSSLREALTQLSAEGLTQGEAHRGYVVTPISVQDVVDLARVRTVVETQCLIWAIENGTLEWESNIVAATHRLVNSARELDQEARPSTWIDVHAAYHAALVGSCGSLRLLQIRNNLYEQSERYRRLELSIPHDRNADSEHRLLAEAAIARDTPMATRLMHSHINRTTEFIVRALMERQSISKPLRAPGKGAQGAPQIEDGEAAVKAKAAATKSKPVAPKAKAPVKVVAKPRTNGAGRALA